MSNGDVPLRQRIFKAFFLALTVLAGLVVLYAIVALVLVALGVWGGA